jgi:RNA polymerase sigma factor (TIGR02999 family)
VAEERPITALLRQWRGGDEGALERLVPLVQNELKSVARRHLSGERRDHTLQPTALVNEAYLKLFRADVEWQDRAHFLAVAARIMRRVLIDHARTRRRDKRGGGWSRLSVSAAGEQVAQTQVDVLELDDALERLAAFDERKSRILELTHFGGLSYDALGEALEVSPATVHRELRLARAWLRRELGTGRSAPG